jgi:heme-degrading monooxygenase HmoA
MAQLYTAGDWLVREGKETEFVEAWKELAEWTAGNVSGAGWATLLRDTEEPRRFLSFGPWQSLESIEAWRGSEGFQQRVGRIHDLLEKLRPQTLEVVAESGRA